MFIIGIWLGALFSFVGGFVVTSSFRFVDYGYTTDNAMFLGISLFAFIILLLLAPFIIKRL